MENISHFADAERIYYDNINYLYLSLPVTLVWQWISALFLGAIIYDKVDNSALSIWLLLSTIVFLYRYYHYYLFRRSTDLKILKELKVWKHRFFADTLLTGILWGSSALLIFPQNSSNYQIVLILFIFLSSFIAMSNLSSNFQLLLLYSLVAFMPLVVRLLFIGKGEFTNLALIVIALMIIIILISKFFGNVVNTSIKEHKNFLDLKHSHEVLQEKFFGLFERAPVGIVYYDKELNIQDCNSKFAEIHNANEKRELIGKKLTINSNKNLIKTYLEVFNNRVGQYFGASLSIGGKKKLYLDLNSVPLANSENKIIGGIAILKDITEEINAKEKIIRNMYYDMLTNIPNRTLFMDRLKDKLKLAKEKNFFGAVLYFDIDNFKKVNEIIGYEKGDLLLKQVTTRVMQFINKDNTFARIGGDKFVILMPKLNNQISLSSNLAYNYAENLRLVFSNAFQITSEEFYITVSIGLSVFPSMQEEDENEYDVLKKAEIAMYESKRKGKNQITIYDENLTEQAHEYITINNELRKAIQKNELYVCYQPQINIQNNTVNSAEALVRWKHPTKGLIPPAVFIPIAEESGYIKELSAWIIEQVLKDIKQIINENGKFPLKYFAININSIHFLSPTFEDELKYLINKYKIPPEHIEIEITEGVVIQNIDEAISKMHSLKNYGFKISMDDFGTGYSSLSYLSKLPFDTLKIDQFFIKNMIKSSRNRNLVYSIIELAKNFNMQVVAEGVENIETLELLRKTQCDLYQGFLGSKAMSLNSVKNYF